MEVQIKGDLDKIDKIVRELFSTYEEYQEPNNDTKEENIKIEILGVDPVIYLEKTKSDLLKSLKTRELDEINEYLEDALNNIEKYGSSRKSVSHIINGVLNELLEQPELYPLQLDPEDGIEFLLSKGYLMPSDIIKNEIRTRWADITAKKILEDSEILRKIIEETNFVDISEYELIKDERSVINILIKNGRNDLLKKLINLLHNEGKDYKEFKHRSMTTEEVLEQITKDESFRMNYLKELYYHVITSDDTKKILIDAELYKHPEILVEAGMDIKSEEVLNYVYKNDLVTFKEMVNKLYEEVKDEFEYDEFVMNLFISGMQTVIGNNLEKIIFDTLADYVSNEKENTERVRKVLENINEFYETDENRKMSIIEKISFSLGRFDPYREKKTHIREALYTLDEIIEYEKSKNWLDKINRQYLDIDIIMQILGHD